MTDHGTPPSTELALLRSELLLPLTELRGDVRLILQRMDQGDARAAEHATELRRLDERADTVERDYVPRAEMTLALADLRSETERKLREQREEQANKERNRLTIIALILTAVSIVSGVATSVIIAIATAP